MKDRGALACYSPRGYMTKNRNARQKQYCGKFNKDFKTVQQFKISFFFFKKKINQRMVLHINTRTTMDKGSL